MLNQVHKVEANTCQHCYLSYSERMQEQECSKIDQGLPGQMIGIVIIFILIMQMLATGSGVNYWSSIVRHVTPQA